MATAPRAPTHSGAVESAGKLWKLLVIIAGIYVCYLYYGVVQEQLYEKQPTGETFGATAFVLFTQCLVNALVAAVGMQLHGVLPFDDPNHGPPPPTTALLKQWPVMLVAAVYVFAMFTSNEALKYVSYPFQALAKSSKMVPVMLGSILIAGKRYGAIKYLCVALITAGVAGFQFAKSSKKSHGGGGGADEEESGQFWGILLLLASLALDGASGPGQELLKHRMKVVFPQHGMGVMQQMFASNFWATIYMAAVAAVAGQISAPLDFLSRHPELRTTLLLFSLTSAFGQIFIFWCIREFGSLLLSLITTTRKFATILLSVVVNYPKNQPNAMQWLAIFVTFMGIGIDMMYDSGDKHKQKKAKEEPPVPQSSAAGLRGSAAGGAGGLSIHAPGLARDGQLASESQADRDNGLRSGKGGSIEELEETPGYKLTPI